MIDPGVDAGLAARARATQVDWKNGYLGPDDEGRTCAFPAAAAEAVGVDAVDAPRPLRATTVLEPVRVTPAHRAEMISEIRAGERLRGVMRRGDWWLVAGEDDYVGWVHAWVLAETDATSAEALSDRWTGRAREPLGTLWMSDLHACAPLMMGTPLLRPDAELVARGDWRLVSTVLGHEGWIPATSIEDTREASIQDVIRRARQLLGTPYRWGGRSPMGFDCSGLVQFVFGLAGTMLPRDASQQQFCGEPVGTDPEDWRAGDVLFFGEPADHVGIHDGRGGMFHCRASVRCDRFEMIEDLVARLSSVRRLGVPDEGRDRTLWVR